LGVGSRVCPAGGSQFTSISGTTYACNGLSAEGWQGFAESLGCTREGDCARCDTCKINRRGGYPRTNWMLLGKVEILENPGTLRVHLGNSSTVSCFNNSEAYWEYSWEVHLMSDLPPNQPAVDLVLSSNVMSTIGSKASNQTPFNQWVFAQDLGIQAQRYFAPRELRPSGYYLVLVINTLLQQPPPDGVCVLTTSTSGISWTEYTRRNLSP
jgi:hypothetical protein